MDTAIVRKRERSAMLYQIGMFALFALTVGLLMTLMPSVYATGGTSNGGNGTGGNGTGGNTEANTLAQTMVGNILIIIYNIVTIVGIIFIIIGLVKFVIAHANEQGPEQQKAAMMMATGVVLVLLPTILRNMELATKITPITG